MLFKYEINVLRWLIATRERGGMKEIEAEVIILKFSLSGHGSNQASNVG